MSRIIFATSNEGKMKEVRLLLGDLGMEVLSLKEAGLVTQVEEDGNTFEENAFIKAREFAKLTNDYVLADDSGLEIDYLNKEPGIYSARYLGETTSYHIKNNHLIERLEGVEDAERTARFVCVIACVKPNGEECSAQGTIEGRIGYEEVEGNGFGYDPIFFVPTYGKNLSQFTLEEKNEISHRGKALRAIKEMLK